MNGKVISHRGDPEQGPENTLPAIQSALSLGVDVVEIDVQLSKDSIPVLMHDHSTARTSNSGHFKAVGSLTLDELGHLTCQSKAGKAPIPSLKDVLQLDFSNSSLMIELKPEKGQSRELVAAVLASLEKHPEVQAYIGSQYIETLEECRKHAGSYPLIGIIGDVHPYQDYLELPLEVLAIGDYLLDEKMLGDCSRGSKELWVWTVNDPSYAKLLLEVGLRGIITDAPREMLSLLR